jgi:predicted Zn-dependent protease
MIRVPDDQLAFNYELAKLSFEHRDYIGAASRLVELVEVEPGNTSARLLLARSYFHSAQLVKAEYALREVLDRDPTEAYAHLMLGRVLQRQSRHDEARTSFSLAVAMNTAYVDEVDRSLWRDSPPS